MQLSQNLVVFAGLACVAQGAFWTDILKGIQNAGRYKNFFDAIGDVTDELLSDEGEAATFICEIIHGDIPDVVEALPSAVINEVEGDFQALTSFVGGLPSLVPEVFSEIVQGGEVVVSIVEEIVTAPGEALTVVEDGVVSVWSDITAGAASVVDDVTHFIGCGIFNEGCSDSTSFTDNGILERCSSVLEGVSSSAVVSSSAATPTSTSVVLLTTNTATPGSSLQTALPTQTAVDTTNLLDVTPSSTLVINATSTSVPASTNEPPINGVVKENGNLKFAAIALGFTFMFLL